MKIGPVYIFLVLLFGVFSLTKGQNIQKQWFELLDDPNTSVSEVREAAKGYFESVGTDKGSGWKQFKRWEYYHSRRLGPNEPVSNLTLTPIEIEKYQENHSILRQTSSNGDWSLIGPTEMPTNGTTQPNGLGRVNCIAVHPTDSATLFLGTPSGGFWKTTDHGSTWNDLSTGFTRLGISSIAVHPTDHDTIYVGTGDRDAGDAPGYGVWRSTDGGVNWAAQNSGMGNRSVYVLLMHPDSPDTLIATTSNWRIYRSTNGGTSWTFTTGTSSIKDMKFKPGDPDIIYGGGYYNGSTSTFSRSTDNGVSWTHITSGLPTGTLYRYAIAVSPDEPNWVYALVGDPNGFTGLYRSTNSGVSFTTRSTSPNILGYSNTGATAGGQAWYDHILTADPADATSIYAGGVNMWNSANSGTSWSLNAFWLEGYGVDDVHADQHFYVYSNNGNVLYNGNDGGIYYTTNGGTNWTEISSGLPISQLYKIGQAQTDKDLIISGYQDNGTTVFSQSGFTTEIGGDGMECTIDPGDDNYQYGALYNGDIRRSSDGGLNFSTIVENGFNGVNESGGWVTPYKLDPTDPTRMYAGYRNLWRSDNVKNGTISSISFSKITSLSTTLEVVDIGVSIANNDVVYFSREDGSFYSSTNATAGTPSWTTLTGSLPVSAIVKDIEIDPVDATHLWIAQNFDVYESTNSGSTWTNISGTLPNISLNCIVYDTSSSNDALYVGMDAGIYYLDNGLGDWVGFSDNLPNLEVTELEIYYDNSCGGESRIRAATYGRGVWESDLRDPGTLSPTACFEASMTSACIGQTVQLQDLSVYPSSWTWVISPTSFTYYSGSGANDQSPYVQFTAAGNYSITLNVSNGNGSDNLLKSNLISISAANNTPVSTDFESESACGTSNDCGTTNCNLANGWSNGTNGIDDDIDWRIDANGTGSSNTGPSVDYNPGTGSGQYVYLEASGCSGQSAFLFSPCIDLTDRAGINLFYAYHMYGTTMGELRVDVLGDAGYTLNVAEPVNSNLGNVWNTNNVNLDGFADQVIQIRFRGATGTNFESDIALDDIDITSVSALPIQNLQADIKFVKNEGVLLTWEGSISGEINPGIVSIKRLNSTNSYDLIQNSKIVDYESFKGFYLDDTYSNGLNYYQIEILNLQGQVIAQKYLSVLVEEEDVFLIYPNPTHGIIHLKIGSKDKQAQEISIYDLFGRTIKKESLNIREGIQIFDINLQLQPAGIYFLRIGNRVKSLVLN